MENTTISEIQTEVTELNNDDLFLVSKKNGNSFTSGKMKAGVLSNINNQDSILSKLNEISNSLSSLNTKVDNIQITQNNHTEYLSNLTDLNTRIGNKIFAGEYGENKTLTLTTTVPSSKCTLSGTPTMSPEGGTYPSGTRVVITAPNPTDTLNYKFKGWYQGTALVSNQQSYSYEVTSNATLNGDYEVITRNITPKLTITNNTNRIIGRYSTTTNWSYKYNPGETNYWYVPDSTLTWNNERGWINNIMWILEFEGADGKPVSDVTNLFNITNTSNCRVEFNQNYKNYIWVYAEGTPDSTDYINSSFTISLK